MVQVRDAEIKMKAGATETIPLTFAPSLKLRSIISKNVLGGKGWPYLPPFCLVVHPFNRE